MVSHPTTEIHANPRHIEGFARARPGDHPAPRTPIRHSGQGREPPCTPRLPSTDNRHATAIPCNDRTLPRVGRPGLSIRPPWVLSSTLPTRNRLTPIELRIPGRAHRGGRPAIGCRYHARDAAERPAKPGPLPAALSVHGPTSRSARGGGPSPSCLPRPRGNLRRGVRELPGAADRRGAAPAALDTAARSAAHLFDLPTSRLRQGAGSGSLQPAAADRDRAARAPDGRVARIRVARCAAAATGAASADRRLNTLDTAA